ncbi:succinate dehydrogenase cytochrome b560 subunit [Penicillium odoratum]|uniref:succinate dehydrogenase cytochrome b560 subunit n=1 Tax=Penicillium odoratum TaxID=1167516 RepID=UPI0025478F93|nr:succinate dehydrogenase cytochrome b560 subunit [Penicillium odoratum]KAJ5769430.1 succinate dehydrogenase cytochrome b560 subunit [Penicillium odoratum]
MLFPLPRRIPTTTRLLRFNGLRLKRSISTESPHHRLATQRLQRPVSPHLSVYKWEFVSSASAIHRITGILLAGSLYGLATFYLLSPTLGIRFDSATLVEAFGALPATVKTGIKFAITTPFTFHAFNGLKQLIWDTGFLLGKKQSGRASWMVLVCSMSASLGLALYKPNKEEDI